MYFKCHLGAEGDAVADRHHLSLSEMAALRKTHFLLLYTLLTVQLEYYCGTVNIREICRGGWRE